MTTIFGIDFTSAPRKAKPIVAARASFINDRVQVEEIVLWKDFLGFESFLNSAGPWFAGMDFPLGQANELVADLRWPPAWNEYVEHLAQQTKADFSIQLETYSKAAIPGKKHLKRFADKRAAACSPMMLYGVPVAKMFYEGVTRLRNSKVSVFPCRPTDDSRVAIETYPALVARQALGRRKYKSNSKRDDGSDKQNARAALLDWLTSSAAIDRYGSALEIPDEIRQQSVHDYTGDWVDAISCCLQAAWASQQDGFGMSKDADSNEGWIFDPGTLEE